MIQLCYSNSQSSEAQTDSGNQKVKSLQRTSADRKTLYRPLKFLLLLPALVSDLFLLFTIYRSMPR